MEDRDSVCPAQHVWGLLGRREGVARGSKATDSLLFLLRLNRFPGMIYFLYAFKTISRDF